MTKKPWTREMYMQLEELLIKGDTKHRKDKLCNELGVTRIDINYRLRLLNERKNVLTWRKEEFDVLKTTKSFDDFLIAFRRIYWDIFDPDVAQDHWKHREDYLEAYKKEQKKVHNVTPKTKTITEPAAPQKHIPILDEHDVFRKILETLQNILQVEKDTYALFKQLSEKQSKDPVKDEKPGDDGK